MNESHESVHFDLRDRLRDLLESVKGSGDFCAGGPITLPNPGLRIEGVGLIAMPLISVQAEQIKSTSSLAPYGKGPDTIVDTSVRKAFQVEAARVSMSNNAWSAALQNLVSTVAKRLGTNPSFVDSFLYKIFLYEKGGHFKAHKDTEKAPGMFGTLVVQFPSEFTGGAFIVRHCGIERTFDLSKQNTDSNFDFCYTAHFADCEHEIMPVTSGVRLVAVYSLCWKGNGPPPHPPSIDTSMELAKYLNKADRCLGWVLDHQYTPASLERYGCYALKGKDRAIADCILTASDLMRKENPDHELAVFIVKAERIDYDEGEGQVEIGEARLDLIDGVHSAEGLGIRARYTPIDPRYTAALRSLRFFDDILNQKEGMESDEDEYDLKRRNDNFWRNCLGRQVSYAGNEGGEGEKLYSCYVLTLMRKSCVDDLSFEGCPAAAIRAVRQEQQISADTARAKLMRLIGTMNHAVDACSDVLLLAAELEAPEIFLETVHMLELQVKHRVGGVSIVDGFTESAAASSFAVAAKRFGHAVLDQLNIEKLEDKQNSNEKGYPVFVIGFNKSSDNIRAYSSLKELFDAELELSNLEKFDDVTRLTELAPLLLAQQAWSKLKSKEFAHVLRGCSEKAMVQHVRTLIKFLASEADSDEWYVDREPSDEVVDAIVLAVTRLGWPSLGEAVTRMLQKSAKKAAKNEDMVFSRLRLICHLKSDLAHSVLFEEIVQPLLSSFTNNPDKSVNGSDQRWVSAGLLLLIEVGGAKVRAKAVKQAANWSIRYSQVGKLVLALAMGDSDGVAGTWLEAVAQKSTARSFACDLAVAMLRSEQLRQAETAQFRIKSIAMARRDEDVSMMKKIQRKELEQCQEVAELLQQVEAARPAE